MSAPEAAASAPVTEDVLDTPAAGRLLVRGAALRLAGYGAMLGLSVLMAAVLTRHLGPAQFGLYTTVISVATVAAAVTDAGMTNIGTREYAVLRGPERDELMSNLFALRVAMMLSGVVLTLAFALAVGYRQALVLGALTASLAAAPLAVQHTLSIPLQAELRLGVVAGLDLARQILWVAGVVALAAAGAGVLPLLSVPLLVNFILIVPTARLVRGRIARRPVVRPSTWPGLLRITVVYSLASAVGVIYAYTAQIVTSLVTSHHQNGLFAVSFRVFIVAITIPGVLASATLPVLARAARDDAQRLSYALQRIFELLLVTGLGAALAISAGSGFIVSVVAGSAYRASGSVLAVQAFALIASFLAAGWSFALLSLRRHRQLLTANVAALLVSLGLTLVLAHSDGARGAAIATICGEATLAAGTGLALFGRQGQHRPRVGVLIKVLAAGSVAGVAAMVPAMPSIVRAVVVVAVYGTLVLVMRAVPGELRDLLPARDRSSLLA